MNRILEPKALVQLINQANVLRHRTLVKFFGLMLTRLLQSLSSQVRREFKCMHLVGFLVDNTRRCVALLQVLLETLHIDDEANNVRCLLSRGW